MSGMLLSGVVSTVLSGILVITAVHVAPPSIPPAGPEENTWAKQLNIEPSVLQETTPVRQLDLYLNGFHFAQNRPEVQEEAHHYCQLMNEEFAQCVIYGGNGREARLIGVEYMISPRLFHNLPEEERRMWSPLSPEVKAGLLIVPGLPQDVERQLVGKLAAMYAKTWHLWHPQTDALPVGHAPELPVGPALLMKNVPADGQIRQELVEERDRRFQVSTQALRQQRAAIGD